LRAAAQSPAAQALPLRWRGTTGYNSNGMWRLVKEFLLFLRQEKKWWLWPLMILLLLLAAIIVFSTGSVLAPLMYPFM
jgi:hypothetical protein